MTTFNMRMWMAQRGLEYKGPDTTEKAEANTGKLDVEAILEGMGEYQDEVKANTEALKAMAAEAPLTEELQQTLLALQNLDTTVTKLLKGDKVTGADLKQWFTEFRAVADAIDNNDDVGGKNSTYTDVVRAKKREAELERAERIASEQRLTLSLGDAFENVVVANADKLSGTAGAGLKTALFGLFGPAAPLVGMIDKLVDIEDQSSKLGAWWSKRRENKEDAASRKAAAQVETLAAQSSALTAVVNKVADADAEPVVPTVAEVAPVEASEPVVPPIVSARPRDDRGRYLSTDPNHVKPAKVVHKHREPKEVVARSVRSEVASDKAYAKPLRERSESLGSTDTNAGSALVAESIRIRQSIDNQTEALTSLLTSQAVAQQDRDEELSRLQQLNQEHQDNWLTRLFTRDKKEKDKDKKPKEGSWLDKFKKQFGKIGNLAQGALSFITKYAKVAGKAVGIVGGAYGLYDAGKDLAGDKYKNADGTRKGFVEGGLDSRAGSYAQSALSGAALGASIGSIFPGIGTAIGAAVGGAVGVGSAFVADYHEEIAAWLKSSGVSAAWDTSLEAVKLGYNWLSDRIGAFAGWLGETASDIAKSGILGFVNTKAKKAVTLLTSGLSTANSYLESLGTGVSEGLKDLVTSSRQQLVDYFDKLKTSYSTDGVLGVAATLVNDYFGKVADMLTGIVDVGSKALSWIDSKVQKAADFVGLDYKGLKDKVKAAKDAVVGTAAIVKEQAVAVQAQAVDKAKEVKAQAVDKGIAVAQRVESTAQTVAKSTGDYADTHTGAVAGAAKIVSKGATAVGTVANRAGGRLALEQQMDAQGITNVNERAMLLAQVDHESGFKSRSENLNYTSVAAIRKTFGSNAGIKALSDEQVQQLVKNPEALANVVYADANRSKNGKMGNTEQGDGYRYRGRGMIQLTGKANYAKYSKLIGVDLVSDPDRANDPQISAQIALAFWKQNKLSDKAQQGDVKAVTQTINGGQNGAADREAKFAQYQAQLQAQPVTPSATNAELPSKIGIASPKVKATVNAMPVTTYKAPPPVMTAAATSVQPSSVQRTAPQSLETNVTHVSQAQPSRGGGQGVVPSNSIDSVPMYVSDEGLILLNVTQLI